MYNIYNIKLLLQDFRKMQMSKVGKWETGKVDTCPFLHHLIIPTSLKGEKRQLALVIMTHRKTRQGISW